MLPFLLNFALLFSNAFAQSDEYEYVIIGSGPGGGPLAANLARAGHSVFVIEAGEDHISTLYQSVPNLGHEASEDPNGAWAFFVNHFEDPVQAQRDPKYTWLTPEQEYYVGVDPPGGSEPLGILYPRGATLGGSSNVNAMNFALPPDRDWDAIAELTGDQSWRATAMRTYFERLENNDYLTRNGSGSEGHGFDGYIHSNRNQVDLLRGQTGLLEQIRLLYNAVGHFPNSTDDIIQLLQRDLNSVNSSRYESNDLYNLPLHYDADRRRSSSQTYLRDTVNELNTNGTPRYPLTISTSSLATRIIFDENANSSTPRAVGVEYLRGSAVYRADKRNNGLQQGAPMTVTATREVIVAGGTFNTPQILKLSGIGPAEELESHNISVVVDLPVVGTNLHDNYEAGVHVEAARNFESVFSNCTFLAPGDPCLREWRENGTGAYGIGAAPVSMLYRSSVAETPDADLFFFGAAAALFEGYFPGYSTNATPPNTLFWSVVKMQSRNNAGTVKLRSADPRDVPEINFNYFAEGGEEDLQALVEGVQFVLDAVEKADAPYGPYKIIGPDPNIDMGQSIMDQTFSHHATSTCPIGVNKTSSCVDSQFRVHGVDGLRVVDASVFPEVPGGFPVLPTFMISEKATAVILEGLSNNATSKKI